MGMGWFDSINEQRSAQEISLHVINIHFVLIEMSLDHFLATAEFSFSLAGAALPLPLRSISYRWNRLGVYRR